MDLKMRWKGITLALKKGLDTRGIGRELCPSIKLLKSELSSEYTELFIFHVCSWPSWIILHNSMLIL